MAGGGDYPIGEVQRMLARCSSGTVGQQSYLTDMLAREGLMRVGRRGGTHKTINQRTDDLAHVLLAVTAPHKSAIAEHVRRHVAIMPTFSMKPVWDDALIEQIMAALAIEGRGDRPQSGLIPGSNMPLGSAIERVIDMIADHPDLGEMLKKARFELEVLETPPLYVPQANFLMEHDGRRFDWHYSGDARYVAHDGSDVPQYGPLIRSVRLGADYFIGAAEIWAGTKQREAAVMSG